MLISTYSSVADAWSDTRPPLGVNLRALSASVLTMNMVSALSAFTRTSVGCTSRVIPFWLKV